MAAKDAVHDSIAAVIREIMVLLMDGLCFL